MTAFEPQSAATPGPAAIRRAIPRDEQGYILLAAIFFLALLVISLAVAAPRIARAIQRDREVETFHRGMQYRRAVQLYYRKFHAYPPNVDALVKTNEIRFLRKKYIDPMTGKDDWKPVLYGQNKTPTAMGFFGQPLSGNATTIAGVGPSGGNGLGGSSTMRQCDLSFRRQFTSRWNPAPATPSSARPIPDSGSTSTPELGQSVPAQPTTLAERSGSTSGRQLRDGTGSGTSSSGQASTGSGLTGQTFGGAGIIGFSPASSKQSILVYKKKNHYNEWEFTYDPLSDMQTMSGGNTGTVGQPASSTSSPVGSHLAAQHLAASPSPTSASAPCHHSPAVIAPVSRPTRFTPNTKRPALTGEPFVLSLLA